MARESGLITPRKTKSIQLECTIDLTKLFATDTERKRFKENWPKFLSFEPCIELYNRLYAVHMRRIPETAPG